MMVQGQGKKMAAKKEEAFEHAHSGFPLWYEAGIANSCPLLHLLATISMLD